MPTNEKRTITLHVAGYTFRPNIDSDDEFYFREGARKLGNRINSLYNANPKVDYKQLLVMIALEKAIDCERLLNGKAPNMAMDEKFDEWANLIDRVLGNEEK